MEIHINRNIEGVLVRPELVSAATWDTKTETDIENLTDDTRHVTLKSRIVDDEDIVFGQAQTELDIAPGERVKVIQSVLAYGVRLRGVDEPVYTMVSELYDGDALAEERRTRFGYSTKSIDKGN